ncbi:MAG: TlpA family protein disulfide reductase [Myxococcales bacterium]|nr:MAG: TlpA family protein disulfide reductase [Myxococcales bacterium]
MHLATLALLHAVRQGFGRISLAYPASRVQFSAVSKAIFSDKMKNWIKQWPSFLLFAVFLAVVIHRAWPSVLPEGQAAPPLKLRLDNGAVFDLAKHEHQAVILNFWGTYCGPCRKEAPELGRAYLKLKRKNVTMIGVTVDQAPLSNVVKIGRALGMTYPIAMAPAASLESYKVETIPTTYVIDRQGKIRASWVGTVSEKKLLRAVQAL